MKKILIITAFLFSCNFLHAQIIHRDGTLNGLSYCNVQLTDTASGFTNQVLKLHVDIISDQGDSANGAILVYTFYTINRNRMQVVYSSQFVVNGMMYENWNANDPTQVYEFTQEALATQNITIVFEP